MIAVAVLVVAIGAAFAVPSARTAILRWLGLEHVRVVRVDQLPPTRRAVASDLGTRVSLREARRLLPFEPLRLRAQPDAVFVQRGPGGARLSFVYGAVARPRLTLSEFQGTGVTQYIEKLVGEGTKVERVDVDGEPGLWLSGKPHAVFFENPNEPRLIYPDEPLLAGNTLVWERRGLTLRIEGDLSKADALRLASSLR